MHTSRLGRPTAGKFLVLRLAVLLAASSWAMPSAPAADGHSPVVRYVAGPLPTTTDDGSQPAGGDPPHRWSRWSQRGPRYILVGPPAAQPDSSGELVIGPNVRVQQEGVLRRLPRPSRGDPGGGWPRGRWQPVFGTPEAERFDDPGPGLADPPAGPAPAWPQEPWPRLFDPPVDNLGEVIAEPMFDGLLQKKFSDPAWYCGPLGFLFGEGGGPLGDAGIGSERVALAPMEMDITQPMPHFRLRFDAGYNLRLPDRSEYFWARPRSLPGGRGPRQIERAVDFQELRFLFEMGGEKFTTSTEIPLRMVAPDVNPNTAGMSDMNVATKLLLLDGDRWQMAQIFRTYFPTGSARKGLGTGHVSMEPGLLFRYRWSDQTYLHSEVKFWFPLGGHPEHAGEVLRYGFGISHLYYETDTFAVIPTLELVNLAFLDGMTTDFPAAVPRDVNGEVAVNLHPGLRLVADTGGDLGLLELGIGTGFRMGTTGWYDALLRAELRWMY